MGYLFGRGSEDQLLWIACKTFQESGLLTLLESNGEKCGVLSYSTSRLILHDIAQGLVLN